MNIQEYRIYADVKEKCLIVQNTRLDDWIIKVYLEGNMDWDKLYNILVTRAESIQFKFSVVKLEILDLMDNTVIGQGRIDRVEFNYWAILKSMFRRS